MEPSKASRPRKQPASVFWDIEATDWKNVICVALKVAGQPVTWCRSLTDMFRDYRHLFTSDYVWRSLWGGIYDHLIALDWAYKLGKQWRMIRAIHGNGFGTWSVELENLITGHRWIMRDAARLMPSSLEQLGESFGLKKIVSLDRGNLGQYPIDTVAEYCMRDVEVLEKAYDGITRQWMEVCGEMPRDTLAATSTAYIRRTALEDWNWDPQIDANVYGAYYGGRTEVFENENGSPNSTRLLAEGEVYDISSAYPRAMTLSLPTQLIGHTLGRAADRAYGQIADESGLAGIVRAHVIVRPSARFGALPFRAEKGPLSGKLLFPTGEWVGIFTVEELSNADRMDLLEDYTILECWQYDAEPFLRGFMETWYKRKQNAPNEGARYVAKIALNSVSGKLVETPDHWELTEDPKRIANALETPINMNHASPRPYCTTNGRHIWELPSRRHGGLRHSAAGAYVTSRARIQLLHALYSSRDPAYCDTDSVHARKFFPGVLPIPSEGLGSWSKESVITDAVYLAPKLYAYETAKGPVVKAKGFRLRKEWAAEEKRAYFQRIASGKPVTSESTRLFKSALNAGSTEFERITVTRQFRGAVPKRNYREGRPWTVEETTFDRDVFYDLFPWTKT